jgi:HK97 family phage portal protein
VGIFSRFRRTIPTDVPLQPDYWRSWEIAFDTYQEVLGRSEERLWKEQPYLRTVVTFLARNVAQLGLHVFQRAGETDRRRVRDGVLYETLTRPNAGASTYDLIYGLVADLALYDRAFWMLARDAQSIMRLPPTWVRPVGGDAIQPAYWAVRSDAKGDVVKVPPEEMVDVHGWHPASLQVGESPVSALRTILAEQISAAEYRRQVWQRGGRVGAVLSRPAGAPQWSDEARRQFKADWESKFTGPKASQAGGTPLLEDGMTLERTDFSAQDQQYVEGAKLALETVSQVFHLNPTMIGSTENTSYSNVREFRKMLYGDTLGPILAQIEGKLNAALVPRLDARDGVYVEFNIAEKLEGNFEEQTQALQAAVGRPWMSADEARARFNMSAVGGDAAELVTPLNVEFGGQPSPRDSGSQNRNIAPQARLKARGEHHHEERVRARLVSFFDRQRAEVLPLLPRKASRPWWDKRKWDDMLTGLLHDLGIDVSHAVAAQVLRDSGRDPRSYDVAQTRNFLKAVARRVAEQMNATTLAELDAARTADDPEQATRDVYEKARTSRAVQAATTAVTMWSGFGTTEAARQNGGRSTKTWVVPSANPRPTHAVMSGETVGIDEAFSNGADWPADANLTVDEIAGCTCEVEVTIE